MARKVIVCCIFTISSSKKRSNCYVYVKTLESALGNYGEVFEQWFDGANGEGPNGKKQVYDWPLFHETVRRLQPGAIMFSDVGPGCRWVGNESGVAGRTNWSTLNSKGFTPGAGAPPSRNLNSGDMGGECWHPAETDVSIRPGWFWRESENDKVKSVKQLVGIYYTSVGRNSLLLLNVPPDTTGRINPVDSVRLLEFKGALDEIFKENLADRAKASATDSWGRGYGAKNILDGNYDSYWAAAKDAVSSSVTFDLDGEKTFNRVLLQEYIPLGQRVKAFTVEAEGPDGTWKEIASETTIGYKRIVLTDKVTTGKVRITVKESLAPALINGFGLYLDKITE